MRLIIIKLLKILHLIDGKKYKNKKQIEIIKRSSLFDKKWYLETYPDVAEKKMLPAKHYLKYGWKEGRNPSQLFNGNNYLSRYDDVRKANVCPLVHYETLGKKEGRIYEISKNHISLSDPKIIKKSALFDENWYLKTYPNVAKEEIDPAEHYLKYGWKEGYNPSPLFDGNLYLDFYEDVAASGINPLVHYEVFGQKKRFKVATERSDLDVLIITMTDRADGVFIWRVNFFKEQLMKKGYSVKEETLRNPSNEFLNNFYDAKLVIFNRPTKGGLSAQILKNLAKTKRKYVIDTDDLLLREFSSYFGKYKSGLVLYKKVEDITFSHSVCYDKVPLVSVSTAFLAEEIKKKYNTKTFIWPNRISDNLLKEKEYTKTENFKILYVSGSTTHDYDASTVYIDLFNFMCKHKNVELNILGKSSLMNSLNMFENRITIHPFMGFEEMLNKYQECNLLIVPLDDNPFNNAKSNIKYIEAGAVGVPILVKDCDEFRYTIKDNENGFLYHDNFYEKLEYIYEHQDTLPEIGKRAFADVKKNYTTNNQLPREIEDLLCY